MNKMYKCVVYFSELKFSDLYIVVAKNPKEAEEKARYRIENETDYEKFEIIQIDEVIE